MKEVISEWWIGKVLEGSGGGLISTYYPSICMDGLRKATKTLSQDSRSPDRDFNPGLPEYDAGVLTTRPWHPVCIEWEMTAELRIIELEGMGKEAVVACFKILFYIRMEGLRRPLKTSVHEVSRPYWNQESPRYEYDPRCSIKHSNLRMAVWHSSLKNVLAPKIYL
jgi:hypothetical protein